ncbi:MAG: dihydrolipoamide acetyltransferase family protein [Candidatus Brocadiia bacterium]|jgi:pyruvate dehydrogenase E2 component (dihydrolipoamide acetyltransferase)|nr:dihydrolipoamide acetyltransferase family protein [Candidatus Brocadiia bacterium]
MATSVIVPDYGTSVDHVVLRAWLKDEGDPVRRGDLLCELETDKASTELEAFADGVLLRRLVEEGSEVEIGTVIAYIGEPGEQLPEPQAEAGEPAPSEAQAPAAASRKPAGQPREGAGAPQAPRAASPLVRKLARERGVDLSQLSGTGSGGKITREDVLRAAEKPSVPASEAAGRELVLSDNQMSVMRTITRSAGEIIPINLVGRINMAATLARREQLLSELGRKVTYDAFFVAGIAEVLGDFPRLRSRLVDGKLMCSDEVNIGFAVSTEDELYLPVIRDADRKSIAKLDEEIAVLAGKARGGTLALGDLSGAALTISNLGMYPVEWFSLIIPPDQSAALAIGAVEDVLVLGRDGAVGTEPIARVLLSVDHRFINGREAARFLAALKDAMERP